MKELLLMAATLMPEDKILDDLQEAIVNYQVDKTEENKDKLKMHLHLAVFRTMTDGKPEEMAKIMQDMKKFDKQQELFKPADN